VLGDVRVVGTTQQTDVLRAVVTAKAERVPMVELEPVALGAASTLLVQVAASASVALTHGTPDCGRDVARRGRGLGLREPLSGSLGPGEAPGLEPFELQGDGLLDDRGQIAVRYLRTHQGPESLQLVVELRAGRELHLVPGGRQGLLQQGLEERKSVFW
jgi:hypothetical protein